MTHKPITYLLTVSGFAFRTENQEARAVPKRRSETRQEVAMTVKSESAESLDDFRYIKLLIVST